MDGVQFREIERLIAKLRLREVNRFIADRTGNDPDPRVVAAMIMIGGGLTVLSTLLDATLN